MTSNIPYSKPSVCFCVILLADNTIKDVTNYTKQCFFSKVPLQEWNGKYGDDVDYNRTIGCDNAAMEGD